MDSNNFASAMWEGQQYRRYDYTGCKYWVDAAFKMFGNLKAATQGSGKDGATFTNEGSHWNDTECAVMARCIGGVFDFYN